MSLLPRAALHNGSEQLGSLPIGERGYLGAPVISFPIGGREHQGVPAIPLHIG
jgi:hypothetical protein